MLDEVEAEMHGGDASIGEGPEARQTSVRWSRPAVAPFDPKTEALIFQQLDVDSFTGKHHSSCVCIDAIQSFSGKVLARILAQHFP